jgi:adenylate cyclase
MFERAVEIDPDFTQAHALLAWILCEVWMAGLWSKPLEDSMAALAHAMRVAQKAVTLDGNDALCHCALVIWN